MAKGNIVKVFVKRAVKKSLVGAKKAAAKSPAVKRAARAFRDIMFPGLGTVTIYDYSRYAPGIAEYHEQLKSYPEFKLQPKISIVMPTYNTPAPYLAECIESVLLQSYPNWELCIADDASPDKEVVRLIKQYAQKDDRIRFVVRKQNGHISEATNSAISLATGEYVALLDHDDTLWPNALYEIVAAINADPKADLLYSDEDKIDSTGKIHSYPFMKPDWSPEFLESCNYITHFSCIKATMMQKVGGFRKGYEGAQDWDLFIRIAAETDKIVHIPKILYSWRVHEASTAMDTGAKPYVFAAQKSLLADHVERTGQKGAVRQGIIKQHSRVEYEVAGEPSVSLIVYGKHAKIRTIRRMVRLSGYKNVEILPVSQAEHAAAACNKAARKASGTYFAFVNADMPVRTNGWLRLLLGDAQRDDIGAAGGRTLSQSRDRFIRAGVGLGIYGLYAPLLEFMPLDDVHYMRGLYGQSRRNVSAVDSGCLVLKADLFRKVGGFSEDLDDMFIVDLCLKLLDAKQRIVYNPIVESVDPNNITAGDADKSRNAHAKEAFKAKWSNYIASDPYLNPYFTRTNAQLELQ